MAEEIDRDAQLHSLSLTFDAPAVLTSGAVVTPIEDFAVLYRMSTGIYGQYGLRRFNEPFPYARPYVRTLHFGSPYFFEIVVPTVVIAGGIKGLPPLISLVKQIIVEPGRTRRELKENKAGRLKAEEEIIEREERLDDPGRLQELARAKLLYAADGLRGPSLRHDCWLQRRGGSQAPTNEKSRSTERLLRS